MNRPSPWTLVCFVSPVGSGPVSSLRGTFWKESVFRLKRRPYSSLLPPSPPHDSFGVRYRVRVLRKESNSDMVPLGNGTECCSDRRSLFVLCDLMTSPSTYRHLPVRPGRRSTCVLSLSLFGSPQSLRCYLCSIFVGCRPP